MKTCDENVAVALHFANRLFYHEFRLQNSHYVHGGMSFNRIALFTHVCRNARVRSYRETKKPEERKNKAKASRKKGAEGWNQETTPTTTKLNVSTTEEST